MTGVCLQRTVSDSCMKHVRLARPSIPESAAFLALKGLRVAQIWSQFRNRNRMKQDLCKYGSASESQTHLADLICAFGRVAYQMFKEDFLRRQEVWHVWLDSCWMTFKCSL